MSTATDFEFVVRVAGPLSGDGLDALYEAGCDDSGIASNSQRTEHEISFLRASESLREAVISAIRDIRRAKLGLTIVAIEPPAALEASLAAEALLVE